MEGCDFIMSDSLATFCDDFYVNLRVGSQLPLPSERETLLHFLERVQKDFSTMNRFRRNEAGECFLEEDRAGNCYRWVALENRRLASGHVNPPSVDEAMRMHRLLTELAPTFLGLSNLELEYIDLLYGFDFSYGGNHDELICETLFEQSPLTALLGEAGAAPVDFQPSFTIALSEDQRLQAKLDIVSRTSATKGAEGGEEAISVFLTVRRFMGGEVRSPEPVKVLNQLAERCDELVHRYVLPRIIRPISAAISSR